MFGLSFGEIFLLAVIGLIVIGPKQLPEFARQIGRLMNELKRSANSFADEMKQQVKIDDIEELKPHPPMMDELSETKPENPDNTKNKDQKS